jgi:hypothetical protein
MGENFGLFKSFGDKLFEGETPTNLGLIGNISLLDADTSAFISRVIAAGGTLNLTEITAVNNLVLQLKIDNLWTSMKAIYPMVGNSAAACSQNLVSASFTGSFSSGWTFASTGVLGNGSSTFMNTGLNTSTNLTLNSTHLSVYVRNNVPGGYDLGCSTDLSTSINVTALISRYSNGSAYIEIGGGTYSTSISVLDSRGFTSGTTNGSRTQNLYKNGNSLINSGVSAGTFANQNLYLGAINGGGTQTFSTGKEYSFASIGDGFNATQMSNFYTAVQAFQTSLSRQV